MKHNSRKYSIRMSYLKALRRQRIDKEKSGQGWPLYYNNLHQYSKNKIHCHHRADAHDGVKTNNRGRKKYYGQASKRWKPSDLRKVVALEEQLL